MTEMDSASFIETVVTSTRVRLARNLYSYPFPGKMTVQEAKEVIRTVGYELNRLDDFTEYDIGKIGAEEATLLQEKHLISPDLIRRKDISAAFISSDKEVSVMVNEEDHLREQYILKGFDLYKAYERISGIDDGLARSVSFAYDEKLGYLTACPSNLGTGMRASVMARPQRAIPIRSATSARSVSPKRIFSPTWTRSRSISQSWNCARGNGCSKRTKSDTATSV